MGLPLEDLRAKRMSTGGEWRRTATPTDAQISEWAKQVSDLNACIEAMEAALIEQGVDPRDPGDTR
jgi:hypothetical protein